MRSLLSHAVNDILAKYLAAHRSASCRYWPIATIIAVQPNVRFRGSSDRWRREARQQSGH
jgi:hypothetical protein